MLETGSFTATISPSSTNGFSNTSNISTVTISGIITFNNTKVASEEFNGNIIVAPNTDLVLQTLENIKELILGAYSK